MSSLSSTFLQIDRRMRHLCSHLVDTRRLDLVTCRYGT